MPVFFLTFSMFQIPERPNNIHPAIKTMPPKGVIAPNQRLFVITNKYKLPENSTVPNTKAHPAPAGKLDPGHCADANAAPNNPATWYIW